MKHIFKIFMLTITIMVASLAMTSCHFVKPNAEEEAALTVQPWFWGHGGIKKEAVPTGLSWAWWTTHATYFKTIPVRYDESFDDIFSNDNTPLDFNSYITIQLVKGKSPILLENYGKNWYLNNIQVPYRNYTREEVSKYSPFDLISNREVLNRIDSVVMYKMENHIAKLSAENELPIIIRSVVTGAARPNPDQLAEMNNTAAAIQKAKTQERNEEMELIRADAEKARAIADRTYKNILGLSADQFIQLKYIEMIANKDGANIDVLVGSGSSNMWNIRR